MPTRAVAALLVTVSLLAACGGDDDTSSEAGREGEGRTVEIAMVDTAFEPDTVEVERGETVRFVFTNEGELVHEAFLGDEHAQMDHAMEMADDDGHGHGSAAGEAVTLEPGETGELTQTFAEGGTLEIGCHQPGHYEDGMVLEVEVA